MSRPQPAPIATAMRSAGRIAANASSSVGLPGFLLLVGPIVWFVKTNGALDAYRRSLGAR